MKFVSPQPPREQVTKELQSYLGEIYRELGNLYLELAKTNTLIAQLAEKIK